MKSNGSEYHSLDTRRTKIRATLKYLSTLPQDAWVIEQRQQLQRSLFLVDTAITQCLRRSYRRQERRMFR